MKVQRTRNELQALARLCAKAIYDGPRLRGPSAESHLSNKEALKRGRQLVKHCLDTPVTEHG